jgi:hypothetical protein
MFLYAKVVMDNLMAQGFLAELNQELEVKFPPGLNEAYAALFYPKLVDLCEARILKYVLDTSVSLSECSITQHATTLIGMQLQRSCVG